MPLDTPLTPESIDFEVEGSTDDQSSIAVFTDTSKPNSKPAKQNARPTTSKTEQTPRSREKKQKKKATAPDPEPTSRSTTSSAKSTITSTSSSPQRRRSPSASTSFVSSTTFPTVTATTPSASLSHQQRSRQHSSACYQATSVLSPSHNPRVDAILQRGCPPNRGRHSISPMAPDARRAPPVELQGPPRFLRERGLTPSPSAVASRRRSAHRAASRRHSIAASASRTPSPSAISRGHEKHRNRGSPSHRSRKPVIEDVETPSHSHPSRSRSHRHHRSTHDKEHISHHSKPHKEEVKKASTHTKQEKREEAVAWARDARLRGRGPVVAPAYAADDTFAPDGAAEVALWSSSAMAPTLTVEHLEYQKRLQQQQQQQQSQREGVDWRAQNEGTSPGQQSLRGKPVPVGGRLGAVEVAQASDVRAPPPRATSPSKGSQRVTTTVAIHDDLTSRAAWNCVGGDAGVGLCVPVLSAHKSKGDARCMSKAGGGEHGGPPGPAAWNSSVRNGPGSAHAIAAHRYNDCGSVDTDACDDEIGDEVTIRDRGRMNPSPRGGGASTLAQHLPEAHSSSSQRFGLPPSNVGGPSRRRQTATSVAAAGVGSETRGSDFGRSARFTSASPQLAGASPVLHSYVAHSFSSFLPGASTVLGSGGGPAASAVAAYQNKSERPFLVGLEVAVLAKPVAELPPPDVLEHYDALLRRFEMQRRGVRAAATSSVDDAEEREVAALFSLVVHLSLPSGTISADGASAVRNGGAEERPSQSPQRPVTVGDVKDEVALRTGIPSTRQCLVYEAMSLQDSLPVHLLVSAEDVEGCADGHCLRLLCVSLVADTESRRPTSTARPGIHGAGLDFHAKTGRNEKQYRASDRNGGEEDLRSLLLLSPAHHDVSNIALTAHTRLHNDSSNNTGASTASATVSGRRGAVPFTLSQATIKSRDAAAHGDASQRSASPGIQDEAVSRHIDRLRRLYLDNRNAAPTATTAASTYPQPREYLFDPEYHINNTGIVEHADPVVHALQQQLLLSQLTAPARSANAVPPPSESTWRRASHTRGMPADAVVPSYNTALSDALIAALPAPPVRDSQAEIGGVSGNSSDAWVMTSTARKDIRLSGPHVQPSVGVAAEAQSRFSVSLFPSSSSAAVGAQNGGNGGGRSAAPRVADSRPRAESSIAVLRHTAANLASHTASSGVGKGLGEAGSGSDTDEGGVGASWLASSQTSDSSTAVVKAEVASSYRPSTLDY